MTFGEHLEELRHRIIMCLIYLVVGVSISMAYGQELLQWVLVPHYTAVRTENRARLVRRMENNVARLRTITSVRPPTETSGVGKPLLDHPPTAEDWAVLFARDVAVPQIARRIGQPIEDFGAAVSSDLTSLGDQERQLLARRVRELGQRFVQALVEELAPGLGSGTGVSVPNRLGKVERDLNQLARDHSPSQIERLVGWGKDLGPLLTSLGELRKFLEARKAQVVASDVSLERLHAWVEQSRLPDALGEVVGSLERDAIDLAEEKTPPIMVTSYLESAMAYLKVSLVFGVFLTLPLLLYELWKFIGAGLYPHEQKYVVTFLPFSIALFVVGILFGYFAMIPVGLKFLAGWGIEDVNLAFTLENYIGLFFTLTLILGLVFQTPLLMIFFAKIGAVDVAMFRKARRLAIFIGVCLSVVLTPPDPFSWALMAVPMILLYELGIWICSLVQKPRGDAPDPTS